MADSEIEYDDEFVGDAGEEDESGVGHVWIDTVFQNLEDAHYSCGAIVFPACGIGSPHIRLRTWFVAERSLADVVGMEDAELSERTRHGVFSGESICEQEAKRLAGRRLADGLAHEGSDTRLLQGKRLGRLDNSNGRGRSERELGDEAGSECETSSGRPEREEGCGRNDTSDAVSGNGLANSEYAERRQERVNREDGCDRQDSGRQEAYGEPRACGEVLGVVNAEVSGERSHSGKSQEGAQPPEPHRGRSVPSGVVDTSNERSEWREGTGWEAQRRTEHTGVSSGLADSTTDRRGEERPINGRFGAGNGTGGRAAGSDAGSISDGLDHPAGSRYVRPLTGTESDPRDEARLRGLGAGREEIGLADTNGGNAGAERKQRSGQQRLQPQDDLFGGEGDFGVGHNGGPGLQGSNPTDGFWGNPDWLFCRDGKWRPIVSGASALAHGLPRGMGTLSPELRRLAEMAGLDGRSLARAKKYRIGSLKGYGNAIVSEVAVQIIKAYMEYDDERG